MKVVIVGAGPSGLVTCKTLLEAANTDFPFDPIILEQEDNIGGTFRYRSYEVIELQYSAYKVVIIFILSTRILSHPSN